MPPFLVCIHDATPGYTRETRVMLQELAPFIGHRLSIGVVPNWHGEWPLTGHPEYCRLIQDGSQELLLHGYFHQRQRGRGPITLLTDSGDEMNALDLEETRRIIERGQRVFTAVFGEPARGFLAPAWQRGHVRRPNQPTPRLRRSAGASAKAEGRHYDSRSAGLQAGLDYVLGFFSLQSLAGREVPLATWSWDCGRWGWLGHLGHGFGHLLQSMNRGIPTLAIHPNDLRRGFWPTILRLTEHLVETGFEPTTPSRLLGALPTPLRAGPSTRLRASE